jgi:hypothetical protein
MTRDVIYPVFLNCCQHTVDKYWENVFKELAFGNTPYGSYIHNMTFNCKASNGVIISILIDENNVKKTHDDIYNAIKTHLNILSPSERIQAQQDFNIIEDEMKKNRDVWSDIKRKNIKDVLIDIFVIKMSEKYNLGIYKSRYLRSMIQTGILFKAIDTHDIIMENGNITQINGITFENGNLHINLDLYNSDTTDTTPTNDFTKQKMSKLWDKYVSRLEGMKIEY